uniref:Uncharacterized protein n=1 Tax=Anguilla anguilla TaxID=7936 RepID=A0A0E9UBS3_ANGAN
MLWSAVRTQAWLALSGK